jgi:hypothetical protein
MQPSVKIRACDLETEKPRPHIPIHAATHTDLGR